METITIKAHVGHDGLLKLEIPTAYADLDLEIALVLHPVQNPAMAAQFLPADFFQKLDAIASDDMLERPEQGTFEAREAWE